jgi:hypothetical protein
MRTYKDEDVVNSDRAIMTFNDQNEAGEAILVDIQQDLITPVGDTYEADLTPAQIEEIKRSAKNDHLYFA